MTRQQYLKPPGAPNPPLAEIAGDIRYEVVVAERNIAALEATILRKEEWIERARNKPNSVALSRRVDELKADVEDLWQEIMLNVTRLSIAREAYERSQERKAS